MALPNEGGLVQSIEDPDGTEVGKGEFPLSAWLLHWNVGLLLPLGWG